MNTKPRPGAVKPGESPVQHQAPGLPDIPVPPLADLSIIPPSPPPAPLTYADRLKIKLSEPGQVDIITSYVANGGSLLELARAWELRYADIMRWIRDTPDRAAAYARAFTDREEWAKERILNELKTIGLVDLREAFNDDGALKAMRDIPEHIARSLAAVEVDEITEYDAESKSRVVIGHTRKIKFWSKVDALREMGKEFGMFVNKVHIDGKLSLEELVAQSYDKPPIEAELVSPPTTPQAQVQAPENSPENKNPESLTPVVGGDSKPRG